MFKNIQKYLLLNHPLLWNTKVIPTIVFTLIFHGIFFGIGYFNGIIDFQETYSYNYGVEDGVVIFFSVIVTILLFIIWLVYYAKNNAFKSYYPLKVTSLYKEWLIILLISILNITYTVSYYSGKTIQNRTYCSKIQTEKRCKTIEMASIFIDGGFENHGSQDYDGNGKITFQNKKYKHNSLINRSANNIGDYYNRGRYLESIDKNPNTISSEMMVKTWMQKNNQFEIKKMMNDYFSLIKEHHLESNISPEKWFALTYNFPDFIEYEKICSEKPYYNIPTKTLNPTENSMVVDSATVATENSDSTYYVPQNNLKNGYRNIYQSWEDPLVDFNLLRVLLYVSIGFSMLLFSYKVTSGRNWIIAIVCVGLLWMLTGIASIIIQSSLTFLFCWLAVMTFLLIYFFAIVAKNKGKKISEIILNLMLWSFGGFLPTIYGLVFEFTRLDYNATQGIDSPKYNWLENNLDLFTWLNMLIIVAVMFFLTIYVKKWKGIAES